MPPTPIPVGYGIASFHYTRNDDGALNVVTFGFANPAAGNALACATSMDSYWIAHFTAADTCDSYTYEGVNALIETAGGQQSAFFSNIVAGTNVAEPVSPAVAARVTKQTLYSGRKFRGRAYLPPALLAQSGVEEGGVLTGAQQAALQTACNNFLADAHAGGHDLVLLHKDLSTPTTVLTLEVRASVGTQRRRQHIS